MRQNADRGYRGSALKILNDANVSTGSVVTVICKGEVAHTGMIMPRYEHEDEKHIVIKLKSGYNVGIDTRTIESVTLAGSGRRDAGSVVKTKEEVKRGMPETSSTKRPDQKNAKRILLLSTGGTIASRVDYRTGAVTPVLSADDLLDAVPELGRIAAIDSEVVTSEYSENMTPGHWLLLAQRVYERAGYERGASNDDISNSRQYAGVIIAHGTDTMHYTSAFLSFALAGLPIPIVLVGSQRSSDRASSDAATNLVGAAKFITLCGKRGVYIAMHDDLGDDSIACHAGTRVRKNHTSKRDAFQTVGDKGPACVITPAEDAITETGKGDFYSHSPYNPRISLDEKVALIKYHPGYNPELLDHIIDSGYRAIIFEGTGLGHVGRTLYEQVARAAKSGIFLGMTSQCINGRIAMTVYESGRDLMSMGVVPLGDMIPEVALVKAMWAAGNAPDADGIKEIMLKKISSEVTSP